MSQSSDFRTFIGTDLAAQTVVVVFPQPIERLALSREQAQSLAAALMQRALLLEKDNPLDEPSRFPFVNQDDPNKPGVGDQF